MVNLNSMAGLRVKPGQRLRLEDIDAGYSTYDELKGSEMDDLKEKTRVGFVKRLESLDKAQELLWASGSYAILVVLQGMDTAGKDGVVRNVFTGLNPQACSVSNFKAPSSEELDHDYLWRCFKSLPRRGQIGVFNRSYYEEVVVVRVHDNLLAAERLPTVDSKSDIWKKRFEDINSFEHHLVRNGTIVLKFFLHISKEQQRKRLLGRLEDPNKWWKFTPEDFKERGYWDDYTEAYEECLSGTSTKWAPWYIIPADHKWVARFMVADLLVDAIKSLKLEYPQVSKEKARMMLEVKRQLQKE